MSFYTEMLDKFYGPFVATAMAKDDDPIISTTNGYYNTVNGAKAYWNATFGNEGFSILKKDTYKHDGIRFYTATGSKGSGLNETDALADTDKPSVATATIGFKTFNTTFEVYENAVIKARNNDWVDLNDIMATEGDLHISGINDMLFVDADTLASVAKGFESIDRVTISEAAVTALSYTAGDNDLYGLNVSTATYFDPICSHNSGSDREYDPVLLLNTIADIRANRGIVQKIITGTDTYAQMQASSLTQMRYGNNAEMSFTMTPEGPKVVNGIDGGMAIATINGAAVFQSPDVQADGISRIYLIDDSEQKGKPQLSIDIASPTMLHTGNNPVYLDSFKEKSAYVTRGELVVSSRFRQGSIRDLKAYTV